MTAEQAVPRVLIGPRVLDDRICRLMYAQETDEAWAEEWSESAWVRASLLVRHVMTAPPVGVATLERAGIPDERGEWDRETVYA